MPMPLLIVGILGGLFSYGLTGLVLGPLVLAVLLFVLEEYRRQIDATRAAPPCPTRARRRNETARRGSEMPPLIHTLGFPLHRCSPGTETRLEAFWKGANRPSPGWNSPGANFGPGTGGFSRSGAWIWFPWAISPGTTGC